MEKHIRILGWLNIGAGVLGVLVSLLVLGGTVALSSVLGMSGEEALLPMHMVELIGGAIAFFTLLLSLPSLVVGFGLLNHQPWARIAGLVLAALALFHVPLGTALALYTFWVLLQPETEALLRRH